MTLRYLIPVLLAVPVLLVFAACSDDEEDSPDLGDPNEAPETIDVEMTLDDFSFAPAVINADLGDEIFVELANDGESEHTFTLSEFLVDETLDSGEDQDVTFTPNEAGEFTYFCRNHDDMQGTLRIAAPGQALDDSTPAADGYEGGGGIGY